MTYSTPYFIPEDLCKPEHLAEGLEFKDSCIPSLAKF
jgi:hypothetical protein